MSERASKSDLGCMAVFILIIVITLLLCLRIERNDIRDLQRRVGQLESERR